jgi:large subunit ribosomal protein L31e
MEEEKEEEEQKTGEEQKESAETVEEAKAEVEEETEEVSEKEEIPEKEEEVVEEAVEAEGEEIPAPVEEEEAKPPPREEKVEEEEIVEERIYTVPLGKCWIVPPNKRAPKAMRIIRSFVVKHMKLEQRKAEGEEEEEAKRLVISNDVNERVWMRGIEKPPRKIRIRAAKDKEGNVTVYLAEGD